MSREESLFTCLCRNKFLPTARVNRPGPAGPHSISAALGLAVVALLGSVATPAATAATTIPPGATPCFTNAVPADYGTFLLLKQAIYQQSSTNAPAGTDAVASLLLRPPTSYAVSNVAVAGPGNFKAALARQSDGSALWTESGTQADLLPRLAAGAWSTSFQVVLPTGESFFGFFPFLLASNVPPVPQLSNLDAARAINGQSSFSLSWLPWIGSSTNDRVALVITDANGTTLVSAASDCAGQSDLVRGSTSFEIPAGRLPAGGTFTGYLTFAASLYAAQDDSSFNVERAFENRTTRFTLETTGGGGGTPATFLNPVVSGTNLVFTLKGTAGNVQRIEVSTDLVTWTKELDVTLPPGGSLEVRLPIPADGVPRFYRAVAVGGGGSVTGDPATLGITLAGPRAVDIAVTGTAGAAYDVELTTDGTTWTKVGSVTIPAGGQAQVVRVTIPDGKDYALVRAVAVPGNPVVVPAKSPTLSLGSADAGALRLGLTNGTASRAYVLQITADFVTWTDASTVTTDASGAGTLIITNLPAAGNAGEGRGAFYRALAR